MLFTLESAETSEPLTLPLTVKLLEPRISTMPPASRVSSGPVTTLPLPRTSRRAPALMLPVETTLVVKLAALFPPLRLSTKRPTSTCEPTAEAERLPSVTLAMGPADVKYWKPPAWVTSAYSPPTSMLPTAVMLLPRISGA